MTLGTLVRKLGMAAAFTALVYGAGCAQKTGANANLVTQDDGDGSGSAWWQGDGVTGPGANGDGPGGADGATGVEVCDGFDNNGNGLVDEGTDGQPCTGADGASGVTHCISGALVCYECTPGTTTSRDCGCSVSTNDVCNESGRLVQGVCDECTKLTTESCGVDADCKPGDTRVQRCDTCPPGQDCGSSCIGATYSCTEDCKWEQTSSCTVLAPVCDRDHTAVEKCGNCGRRDVTCDGCFFVESVCHDQGACTPGDQHTMPCFDKGCSAGFVATTSCNDQCSWEPATSCDGCVPGTTTTDHTLCVANHAECGEKVTQTKCVGQTPVTSCQQQPLIEGVSQTTTITDECANVQAPDFCTPDAITTEQISCGNNKCGATFTRTHTCLSNGCGEVDVDGGGCPACAQGDTQSQQCTTGGGDCGSQSRTCGNGCGWGAWSTCTALADACQNGATEQRQCTAACNLTGTSTWQCNGCGWTQITECQSAQAQCNPGDTKDLGPCPHCHTTEQTQTCDASTCSWVTSTCPVCE